MRRPMRSTRTRRRQTLAIRRQIPIRRCKSLTEAALQDGPASFDQRSYDRALINSQVRSEIYQRDVSPGFGARTQETVAQYGPLRGAAEHVIAASPAVAEICEYIMDNPESIAALNSMSKHEVELFVARQEGRLSAGVFWVWPARASTKTSASNAHSEPSTETSKHGQRASHPPRPQRSRKPPTASTARFEKHK